MHPPGEVDVCRYYDFRHVAPYLCRHRSDSPPRWICLVWPGLTWQRQNEADGRGGASRRRWATRERCWLREKRHPKNNNDNNNKDSG